MRIKRYLITVNPKTPTDPTTKNSKSKTKSKSKSKTPHGAALTDSAPSTIKAKPRKLKAFAEYFKKEMKAKESKEVFRGVAK